MLDAIKLIIQNRFLTSTSTSNFPFNHCFSSEDRFKKKTFLVSNYFLSIFTFVCEWVGVREMRCDGVQMSDEYVQNVISLINLNYAKNGIKSQHRTIFFLASFLFWLKFFFLASIKNLIICLEIILTSLERASDIRADIVFILVWYKQHSR